MAVLADQTFREDFQRLPKPPSDPKARAGLSGSGVPVYGHYALKGPLPGRVLGKRCEEVMAAGKRSEYRAPASFAAWRREPIACIEVCSVSCRRGNQNAAIR